MDIFSSGCELWPILLMLLGAFLLGYLFARLMGNGGNGGASATAAGVAGGALPLSNNPNDLKVVEGIGPKIEELLKADGIDTWADLASAETSRIQRVLDEAGPRFKMHDPKTWAEQAAMARDGKWSELENFQDFLIGGK